MKNKWRFFAVTLAVVLCMTVFSVTAYAGGGDMDEPTDTMQTEDAEICVQGCELTDIEQTLTVNVTENADRSRTVTIGDRSWRLPAKREQAGKVVNVRTYLNLRTGPGTDYTVIGHLLNGAEVKVLEESNGWYKVVVPEQTGYVCGKYLDVMNAPTENSGSDTDLAGLPVACGPHWSVTELACLCWKGQSSGHTMQTPGPTPSKGRWEKRKGRWLPLCGPHLHAGSAKAPPWVRRLPGWPRAWGRAAV